MIYKDKEFLALFLYVPDFAKNAATMESRGRLYPVKIFTKSSSSFWKFVTLMTLVVPYIFDLPTQNVTGPTLFIAITYMVISCLRASMNCFTVFQCGWVGTLTL